MASKIHRNRGPELEHLLIAVETGGEACAIDHLRSHVRSLSPTADGFQSAQGDRCQTDNQADEHASNVDYEVQKKQGGELEQFSRDDATSDRSDARASNATNGVWQYQGPDLEPEQSPGDDVLVCEIVRMCSAEGCDNVAREGGVCETHSGPKVDLCSVMGCSNRATRGGSCERHQVDNQADERPSNVDNEVQQDRGPDSEQFPRDDATWDWSDARASNLANEVRQERGLEPEPEQWPGDDVLVCDIVRICSAEGCDNIAREGGVCETHSAPKVDLCSFVGCSNRATRGGSCERHGELKSKLCSYDGCPDQVVQGGKCRRHMVKHLVCSVEGCGDYALAEGGACGRHRAPETCKFEGCANRAFAGGMCRGHVVDGLLCAVEGCDNYALGTGRLCGRHEPRQTREFQGCSNGAFRGGMCRRHLVDHRRCSAEGRGDCALSKGDACSRHKPRETCQYEGCCKQVFDDGDMCRWHTVDNRLCSVEGCGNFVAIKGTVCARHTCRFEGCSNRALQGGRCKSHVVDLHRCSVERCNSYVLSKGGICSRHRPRSTCRSDRTFHRGMKMCRKRKCSAEGCARFVLRRGLCKEHAVMAEKQELLQKCNQAANDRKSCRSNNCQIDGASVVVAVTATKAMPIPKVNAFSSEATKRLAAGQPLPSVAKKTQEEPSEDSPQVVQGGPGNNDSLRLAKVALPDYSPIYPSRNNDAIMGQTQYSYESLLEGGCQRKQALAQNGKSNGSSTPETAFETGGNGHHDSLADHLGKETLYKEEVSNSEDRPPQLAPAQQTEVVSYHAPGECKEGGSCETIGSKRVSPGPHSSSNNNITTLSKDVQWKLTQSRNEGHDMNPTPKHAGKRNEHDKGSFLLKCHISPALINASRKRTRQHHDAVKLYTPLPVSTPAMMNPIFAGLPNCCSTRNGSNHLEISKSARNNNGTAKEERPDNAFCIREKCKNNAVTSGMCTFHYREITLNISIRSEVVSDRDDTKAQIDAFLLGRRTG